MLSAVWQGEYREGTGAEVVPAIELLQRSLVIALRSLASFPAPDPGVVMARIDIAEALTDAARTIHSHHDLQSTLDAIIRAAVRSLPGVDHVGVSIVHRDGTIETMAGTDQLVWNLDALQYELQEGPCFEAITQTSICLTDDLDHEHRWPAYVPRALTLGLRSQMGLRLFTEEQTLGGLNLYSTRAEAIDPEARHLAELFATHAALALGRARQVEDLNTALESRKVIGQAIGILMERHRVDEDRAFQFLIGVSNHSNIKLREIAQELVDHTNTAAKDKLGTDED
jgi:GAF domain-containing protein